MEKYDVDVTFKPHNGDGWGTFIVVLIVIILISKACGA